MVSTASLQEKFNAAVKAIQRLPNDEFTRLIGPFYEFVDDRSEENQSVSVLKNKSHHANAKKKKQNALRSLVNGTGEKSHDEYPINHTNGPMRTLVSSGNGPVPSSSPSSSSSSISSSDPGEFYQNPSDRLSPNPDLSKDDLQVRIVVAINL
ncbi:unnamed protein product [Rotaria socialis]